MQVCDWCQCVCFRKRLATMYVFSKAWCKMHGGKNSNVEETNASTTGKRSPPGDCGRRRSVWSGGRQDVQRMHRRWFQKKQCGESRNRNQSWLTMKGHRGRRRRCKRTPDINDQRNQRHRKDTVGGTRQRKPKPHYLKDKDRSITGQTWPNGPDSRNNVGMTKNRSE